MSGSRRLTASVIFGNYEVHGLRRPNEKYWWIEACRSGEDLPKQYRVLGTEFYAVRVSPDAVGPVDYKLDLVTDMDPQERAAILYAIAKWEEKAYPPTL